MDEKIQPAVAARIKELLLSGARLTGSRLDRLRRAAASNCERVVNGGKVVAPKEAPPPESAAKSRSWANVAAACPRREKMGALLRTRGRAGRRGRPASAQHGADDHAYVKSELQRAFQMADEIERSR